MNVAMGVKHNVFASASERENYYKLRRQWGDSHAVYHNLPFLNLFTCDNLIDAQQMRLFSLGDLDRSRMKKTSIDYVLCDKHDTPLVAIDFDGLQEGVNIGTSYYPSRDDSDWRRVIMNLKTLTALSVKSWRMQQRMNVSLASFPKRLESRQTPSTR
jgi:hypothetical protein